VWSGRSSLREELRTQLGMHWLFHLQTLHTDCARRSNTSRNNALSITRKNKLLRRLRRRVEKSLHPSYLLETASELGADDEGNQATVQYVYVY
jgi:hypothetical protein